VRLLIQIFFLIISGSCISQELILNNTTCSYYGEPLRDSLKTFSTEVSEAEKIINEIISVIGLKPHFETRSADIPNAAAIIHKGKRYVLYNPEFVNSLNKMAGNKWAAVSILAHEIGHHLNGHTLEEGGSRPDIELEADEFSGFVLRKLGARLEEAQAAMRIAASVKASHTHPAKADRLLAIQRGWQAASEQISEKKSTVTDPEIKKPQIAESVKKESALAEKYIAYDVNFKGDPSGKYHVTIRNNLVKVEGDKLYIVGRMAESNKKNYAAMLHDQYYNYLYITSSGKILNGSGDKVGTIKKH
jgi:hypothetical protein